MPSPASDDATSVPSTIRPTAPPTTPPTTQSTLWLREAKAELRTALRLRRTVRRSEERELADTGRLAAMLDLFAPAIDRLGMVAVYLSRPDEPDTLQIVAWLSAYQVPTLLPVQTAGADPGTPDWALYDGPDHVRLGRHRVPEPTGRPLGPGALGAAGVIICPGLAASRSGARLGQGVGWYDRALEHARPDAVTALLVDDDEVLDSIPVEPHDHPMDLVITGTQVIHAAASTGVA